VQESGVASPFAGGGTDDFDPTSIQVFVSKTGSTPYSGTNDTATSISQLASGSSAIVYIVSNIPAAQLDGDVAVEALVAQVAATGTAGYGNAAGASITTDQSGSTWTPGTAQNIFADAAGTDDVALDGKSSSRDAYIVKSAKLTITKTATVVSDPTGDVIPHAIPGAIMKYTITVLNSGSQPATGVTLADSIQPMVTSGYLAYKAGSITLQDPNEGSPLNSTQSCSDSGSTGGNFGTDSCGFTSGTNTVNAVITTLSNGQSAVITFQATIQ